MHFSAMLKLRAFRDVHMARSTGRVLDVGSAAFGDHDTFRDLVPSGWQYVGLDMVAGRNVDIVPAHPFLWEELADETFDASVTSSTFEHNPLFWVTLAEMARVTKPGGLIFVIAPGRGFVHRYPLDCWRFFPDAWVSLGAYVGLEPVETHFEEPRVSLVVPGAEWSDSSAVYHRPASTPEFTAQLARIRQTARSAMGAPLPVRTAGPVFARYAALAERSWPHVAYRRLRKLANLPAVARKLFEQA